MVHGTALVVLRDPPRAEDVVQDVFLRLWRRPDAFDPARGDLTAFLRLIARSRAVDLWREGQARDRAAPPRPRLPAPRAREPQAARPELRAAAADTPDGVALRSAERARLRVALRTLPLEQRQGGRPGLFRRPDGGGDRRARRDPARHGQEPRAARAAQAPRRAARRRAEPAARPSPPEPLRRAPNQPGRCRTRPCRPRRRRARSRRPAPARRCPAAPPAAVAPPPGEDPRR